MPETITTIPGMRTAIRSLRDAAPGQGSRIALVPTMGGLHAGHVALIERARELADIVVVSIFVNPLQFSPSEDLDAYPRPLDADLALLDRHGVAVAFAPTVEEMYPDGPSATRVTGGEVALRYEGKSRRGHFDGVLTVVAKLLAIVAPDVVVFGEKDAQQLFLVRRMVADLDIDVVVESVETVRDDDGLAVSTRNARLDERQRRSARALPTALEAAESSADRGAEAVIAAAQSVLTGDATTELDYLAVVDPDTFLPIDDAAHGRALVLVAARVGETRLIDNATIALG
jgi:pantoate--beta-alanine ligase